MKKAYQAVVGEMTPIKQWLVRLLVRKLKRLEENNEEFTRLINPPANSKRGTKPLFRYKG
jgi:hypothetical protein